METYPLLVCRGFDLGAYHVPAFDVRAGEAVTLRLRNWSDLAEELAACLTGATKRPEVQRHGPCVRALRAQPPAGWRRWWSDPRPSDWLVARGFPRPEAAAVLSRHGIEDRFRLSQHAANPRVLLGLEAAYRLAPGAIVFDTTGLDPLGERAVQALVQSRLDRTAAIFLTGPVLSGGIESYREFPGSTVLEVISRPPVPV